MPQLERAQSRALGDLVTKVTRMGQAYADQNIALSASIATYQATDSTSSFSDSTAIKVYVKNHNSKFHTWLNGPHKDCVYIETAGAGGYTVAAAGTLTFDEGVATIALTGTAGSATAGSTATIYISHDDHKLKVFNYELATVTIQYEVA